MKLITYPTLPSYRCLKTTKTSDEAQMYPFQRWTKNAGRNSPTGLSTPKDSPKNLHWMTFWSTSNSMTMLRTLSWESTRKDPQKRGCSKDLPSLHSRQGNRWFRFFNWYWFIKWSIFLNNKYWCFNRDLVSMLPINPYKN